VRGVGCQTATAVVLALRHCPATCGADAARYDARQYTALGFTCAATGEQQPPGGGMGWYAYTCTDGGWSVTFNNH